jgi:hypothetical protein
MYSLYEGSDTSKDLLAELLTIIRHNEEQLGLPHNIRRRF